MLLIVRGAEIDNALGVSGKELAKTAAYRPFVEALRFVGENNDAFWKHVRKWPRDLQDRVGGALGYLRSERTARMHPERGRAHRHDENGAAAPQGQSGR